MSFQDLTGGGASVRQFRNLQRDTARPTRKVPTSTNLEVSAPSAPPYSIRVPNKIPHNSLGSSSTSKQHAFATLKSRRPMIVLHGRVQQKEEECPQDEDEPHNSNKEDEIPAPSSREFSSIRTVMERKSMFSRLSHETQIFGRMVADLEAFLAESGESPEAAWRARILMRSAQETDKELWNKLHKYEKTLQGHKEDADLRQAQTACMKLHRDFKRIHKSLVLTLSFFEKRQKAEISRLGAVGWTTREFVVEDPPEVPHIPAAAVAPSFFTALTTPTTAKEPVVVAPANPQDEDFFDRAIREREAFDRAMRHKEITEINKKMHKVNEIYQDLAQVVDDQQEQIDQLEDDAESANFNVRQARETSIMDVLCTGRSSPVSSHAKCAPEKVGDGIDWDGLFSCGSLAQAAGTLRESYGILREASSDNSSYSDESPVATDPEAEAEEQPRKSSRFGPTKYEKESFSRENSIMDSSTPKKLSRDDSGGRSQRRLSREESNRSLRKGSREDASDRSPRSVRKSSKEEDEEVSDRGKPPRGDAGSESRDRRRRRSQAVDNKNLRVSEEFHWMMPFETLSEDVKAVQSDLVRWGKGFLTPTRRRKSSSKVGDE
ncbi:hypothetical protein ACA910_015501 [Epithemia clementina (nom. ined.)]